MGLLLWIIIMGVLWDSFFVIPLKTPDQITVYTTQRCNKFNDQRQQS